MVVQEEHQQWRNEACRSISEAFGDEWGYVVMPTARQLEIALHCDLDRVYAKLGIDEHISQHFNKTRFFSKR